MYYFKRCLRFFAQILKKYKYLCNWLWLHKITLNKTNSFNKKKMQYFITGQNFQITLNFTLFKP